MSKRAVAMQTEKEADEPRPAPMGRVDRALRPNEGQGEYIVNINFRVQQGGGR